MCTTLLCVNYGEKRSYMLKVVTQAQQEPFDLANGRFTAAPELIDLQRSIADSLASVTPGILFRNVPPLISLNRDAEESAGSTLNSESKPRERAVVTERHTHATGYAPADQTALDLPPVAGTSVAQRLAQLAASPFEASEGGGAGPEATALLRSKSLLADAANFVTNAAEASSNSRRSAGLSLPVESPQAPSINSNDHSSSASTSPIQDRLEGNSNIPAATESPAINTPGQILIPHADLKTVALLEAVLIAAQTNPANVTFENGSLSVTRTDSGYESSLTVGEKSVHYAFNQYGLSTQNSRAELKMLSDVINLLAEPP